MTPRTQHANPIVKCIVNTCNHYLPGDKCVAENIDILNEEVNHMSQNAEQTMCKTFAQKSGIANYLGTLDNKNWDGLVSAFKPGTQITPTVTCIVDTCKYWEQGDVCIAESIEVTGHDSRECQDTNCQTFAKRNE
ncbi:MAG TPA: DUF1540 domain-containing protein [Clostridia bacterium]|jgi:hypothetical protein|nr:DUF1540 domain-containing protein [Clostridia bacterium]HHY06757.1 DUF1540 domain-containing protein [Clostridia bacterium]